MLKILEKRKGFTLVELLVVIGLITFLLGYAVPNFRAADNAGRWSTTDNDAKQISDAIMVYMASSRSGNPPSDLGQLVTGVTADQAKSRTATGKLVIKPSWTTDPASFKDGWDNQFVYDSVGGTISSDCNGVYDPISYSFK